MEQEKKKKHKIKQDTEYTNMTTYISENYLKIKALFDKLKDTFPPIQKKINNLLSNQNKK